MPIPANIIATADDLGMSPAVNRAVVYCFAQGYINSASLLTNTPYFTETVRLLRDSPMVTNIGVHVNLAEGPPVTPFAFPHFLNGEGHWNIQKTGIKTAYLNKAVRQAFYEEITAQIAKAAEAGLQLTHLDSHYHLHTLPRFFPLFIKAALHYRLPLRLAQTHYAGNVFTFLYRRFINYRIRQHGLSFSARFEYPAYFLQKATPSRALTELMLHPLFDAADTLTDHYDAAAMQGWIAYLQALR